MRRGSNNRETPKGVPSSKNNRQLVTCRPFRDSCMRTKPNSYRHGSYRLGRVYRQGTKTLFHAYGPRGLGGGFDKTILTKMEKITHHGLSTSAHWAVMTACTKFSSGCYRMLVSCVKATRQLARSHKWLNKGTKAAYHLVMKMNPPKNRK